MATINQASTQCPSTKIVLGGYSQGGQILHDAAAQLTAAVTARIAAGQLILPLLSLFYATVERVPRCPRANTTLVVVFGDPDVDQPIGSIPSSKILQDCHVGDIICTGSGGAAEHLNYPEDAEETAAFVASKV